MLLKLLKYAVGAFVFLILLVVVINVVVSSAEKVRQEQQAESAKQASKQAALDAAFSRAKADTPKAVLEALTKAFTPMPAGWGSFSVPTAMLSVALVDGTGVIVVSLDYAEPPSGEDQAERDTRKVVGVVLDWLRSLGKEPREQWIKVRVIAQKTEGDGEREIYGESSYDFQKDLVAWVKYDPSQEEKESAPGFREGLMAGLLDAKNGAIKPSDAELDAMARRAKNALATGQPPGFVQQFKTGYRLGWTQAD